MQSLHRLLALALPLAFIACGGSSVPTIETTTFASSLNVNLPASTKTAHGEYFRDLVAGTGAVVSAGQSLTVKYNGWFPNGTLFNGPDQDFSFHLGQGEVIAGWDEGLAGVKVGSTRQLIVPPSLGYGSQGYPGAIPPNAILVFSVQVISAQ